MHKILAALLLVARVHAASIGATLGPGVDGPHVPWHHVSLRGAALQFQAGGSQWLQERDGVTVRALTDDGSQVQVSAAGAPWVRLNLYPTRIPAGGFIKIVSMRDGHVQYLDERSIEQWQYTSAYFNGDNVTVLYEAPDYRIKISGVDVGDIGDGSALSICNKHDERKQSSDGRSARMMPVGCTAWLINDQHNCMLSAGHCVSSYSKQVLQFQVPLSLANGAVQHPSPDHQYPIDPASVQSDGDGGVDGDDWFYLGAFANSNTGLSAGAMQRETYKLATNLTAMPAVNASIDITGYGVTYDAGLKPLSQVQQTHRGSLYSVDARYTMIKYRVDTTGGNSGSAVVDIRTGHAIGIHTNGGCSYSHTNGDTVGYNFGTLLSNQKLQRALANPLGVCKTGAA